MQAAVSVRLLAEIAGWFSLPCCIVYSEAVSSHSPCVQVRRRECARHSSFSESLDEADLTTELLRPSSLLGSLDEQGSVDAAVVEACTVVGITVAPIQCLHALGMIQTNTFSAVCRKKCK